MMLFRIFVLIITFISTETYSKSNSNSGWDYENGLVSVESVYFDSELGRDVKVEGVGTLVVYKGDHQKQPHILVLTASHVSGGRDLKIGRLKQISQKYINNRGALYLDERNIGLRIRDVINDIELIEINVHIDLKKYKPLVQYIDAINGPYIVDDEDRKRALCWNPELKTREKFSFAGHNWFMSLLKGKGTHGINHEYKSVFEQRYQLLKQNLLYLGFHPHPPLTAAYIPLTSLHKERVKIDPFNENQFEGADFLTTIEKGDIYRSQDKRKWEISVNLPSGLSGSPIFGSVSAYICNGVIGVVSRRHQGLIKSFATAEEPIINLFKKYKDLKKTSTPFTHLTPSIHQLVELFPKVKWEFNQGELFRTNQQISEEPFLPPIGNHIGTDGLTTSNGTNKDIFIENHEGVKLIYNDELQSDFSFKTIIAYKKDGLYFEANFEDLYRFNFSDPLNRENIIFSDSNIFSILINRFDRYKDEFINSKKIIKSEFKSNFTSNLSKSYDETIYDEFHFFPEDRQECSALIKLNKAGLMGLKHELSSSHGVITICLNKRGFLNNQISYTPYFDCSDQLEGRSCYVDLAGLFFIKSLEAGHFKNPHYQSQFLNPNLTILYKNKEESIFRQRRVVFSYEI